MHPRVIKAEVSSAPSRGGESASQIRSIGPERGGDRLRPYGHSHSSTSALKEADVCYDLAAALAQSQARHTQQIALADLTGRPDLAAAYQAQAARDRLDLLRGWLAARHAGHPSLALLRAAARAESRSRYSSRGRRAHRESSSAPERSTQPTGEEGAAE